MGRDLRLQVLLKAVDKITAPLRAMAQSSSKAARVVKETRDRLKQLQQTQNDISSFRALKAASNSTAAQLHEAQNRVRQLARQMAATQNPTAAMKRAFEAAKREAKDLKNTHTEQQQALQRLRDKLRSAGVDTKKLSEHERALKQQVDETSAALDRQTKNLRRAAKQQEHLAAAKDKYSALRDSADGMLERGATQAAIGAGVLMAGTQMLSPTLDATQQGAVIAAQSGETAARGQEYTGIIRNIRADGLSADFAEIGNTIATVKSTLGALGAIGDTELERVSRKALDFSQTMGGDVAENIQAVGILLQNGMASNSDEAFDLLAAGMQRVSTQMRGELPDILQEYSTHFKGMGFSGTEAMSLLVDMAKQGKYALDKTGDAVKEFSIAGSDMSKGSKEAYEAMGFNAAKMSAAIARGGSDARNALQRTVRALLKIKDPAERANHAIALFGTPLEDLSIDKIPKFLEALANTKNNLGDVRGTTEALGKTLRDNISGDVQTLGGAWSEFNATLLDTQAGALRGLIQGLTETLSSVRAWIKEHPVLTGGLLKAALAFGVMAAVGGTLTLVSSVLLGQFAALWYGVKVLGVAFWAMARNPLMLVLMGIASAAILIWSNWSTIAPFLSGLWDSVKNAAVAAWHTVVSSAQSAWAGITAIASGLWGEIAAAFNGGLSAVGMLIQNWSPVALFYQAFSGIYGYFGIELPAKFTEFGANLLDGLVNGITQKMGAVKEAITGAGDAVTGWFKERLGIHSPSRVFAELGGWTMEGLNNGLVTGGREPLKTVDSLAKELSTAGAMRLSVTSSVEGMPPRADAAHRMPSSVLPAPLPPLARPIAPEAVQRVTQRVQAAAIPPVPETVQRLTQHLTPTAVPTLPDTVQRVAQRVQVAALPTVPDAVQRLTQQVTRAALPTPPDTVQRIFQQVKAAELPVLPEQAHTINQQVRAQRAEEDTENPLITPRAAPVLAAPQRQLQPNNGGGAPVVQGDTITITVQAPPGADTNALRKMLEQLLDERERGKSARLRSALYDMD